MVVRTSEFRPRTIEATAVRETAYDGLGAASPRFEALVDGQWVRISKTNQDAAVRRRIAEALLSAEFTVVYKDAWLTVRRSEERGI